MTGQGKDLTHGHPARKIVVFAIPLLIGNIFQQFYNMADMVIVGRTIGTQALAAIGATGAIAFLVVGMSFGITSGFTVITAQRFGAGDHDGMRRSVATSVVLSLVISVLITVVAVTTAYTMFEVMRTPADIIDDAHRYIIVIYGGTVVTIFFNLFAGVLRAVGDSRTPLLFLIVACIVNIVLDYVLIVNFHMGVAGAGWATVAAQALSVFLCLVYTARKLPVLRLKRSDWKLEWESCKKHLVIGFSMGMQMAIIAVSTIFFQVGVNSLGTDSVKAFSSAVKIDQLAIQPLFSIGVAVATFTAQNYGAGKFARIREGVRYGSIINTAWSVLGCVLMITAGRWLLGLFGIGANEPHVVSEARMYLNTTSLFYIILGLLFVFRNALQGMGKNRIPLAASAVDIVVRTAMTFTFVEWWGFRGLCFVSPLTWLYAALLLFFGYVAAMRRVGSGKRPTSESVVLNYDAQAKFGNITENVPSVSVEVEMEGEGNRPRDSVRIL